MSVTTRSWRRVVPGLLLGGLALACGGEQGSDGAAAGGDPAAAAEPAVEVPSEEQAAAEAEQTITEQNADTEFDKLKAEIEGDKDDF